MRFEPIAIVGQSCILPGALSPDELWDAVLAGRNLISSVPDGYWRLDKASILTSSHSQDSGQGTGQSQDQTWSDRGGYVSGFDECFDRNGFALPPDEIATLDPLFHWVLHGVRAALQSAGLVTPRPAKEAPVGLVLGNLSYPTVGLVEYAESTWIAHQAAQGSVSFPVPGADFVDPRNRFSSGLPAHLAAQALNLGGEAFALDAACASSLYAIKLACDRLQDRRNDLMVAGAVNRTDDLFIHVGFCALQALSLRGESRPFSATADGLVPAEGAAFVVLKRLADALTDGDEILGIIRGIGLSNDGAAGGFLSPAIDGQVRAMSAAYEMAGLTPGDVSLLECHATGTPVGDAAEIRSTAQVFEGVSELPIGSLKSNLGHLITVAGVAGLLKVLGALRTGTRPPTRPVVQPIPALAETPFRILQTPEPWRTDDGAPRRAAISAFGFGGNNAHLIVEAWEPASRSSFNGVDNVPSPNLAQIWEGPGKGKRPKDDSHSAIAIVDIEVTVGEFQDVTAFRQALLMGLGSTRTESVDVAMTGLRFPPRDLQQTLPQQLLIFEVARRLALRHPQLPTDTTSVFVGMGCDPEIARYGVRWRLPAWVTAWRKQGLDVTKTWLDEAKAGVIPGLEAAGVVGTMPNIPANRINAQLNCRGPSYTVSSEELSGIRALECATDALRQGEIDAAFVGAVDLSHEAIHQQAATHVLEPARQNAGDGAVMLLLKRVADAERDGDSILAILDDVQSTPARETKPDDGPGNRDQELRLGLHQDLPTLIQRFGHAHAASGLLHVAAAVICLQERVLPAEDAEDHPLPAAPWLATDGLSSPRRATVKVDALAEQTATVRLRQATANPVVPRVASPLSLHIYSGEDARGLLRALEAGVESAGGPARLVIVARGDTHFDGQREQARSTLSQQIAAQQTATSAPQRLAEGIYWSSAPMPDELSFVFTGAAAAYQGMGRELLLALPQLGERLMQKFPCLAQTQPWLAADMGQGSHDPFQILQGCTLLCQAHALLTQEWLGLKPHAVLGVSSGETNAVFGLGAWRDMDAMFAEMTRQGMYTREIAGEYAVAHRAWQGQGVEKIEWRGWRVLAAVEEVEAALEGEAFAHLTMINAPADCLIAGQADACRRVVEKIGLQRAVENRHEIIAHHPVMKQWENPWYEIHARQTHPVHGVRFYSNASGTHYVPTRERVATALTDQATGRVDFRRVVNAAWEDGVRIFIEHGPRSVCSGWIRAILGAREHLVVALDRPENGVEQTLDAVAQLVAAGVDVDYKRLLDALNGTSVRPSAEALLHEVNQDQTGARGLTLPAHYAPVKFPPLIEQLKDEAAAVASKAGNAIPDRTWKREESNGQYLQPAAHDGFQQMEPAPPLPPVVAIYPQDATGSQPAHTRRVHGSESQTLGDENPNPLPIRERLEGDSATAPLERERIVERITHFHGEVSAAHQMFLAQQERATTRLLRLRQGKDAPAAAPTGQETPGSLPPASTRSAADNVDATAHSVTPPHTAVDALAPPPPVLPTLTLAEDDKPPAPSVRDSVPPLPVLPGAESLPGPKLSRVQLEHVASGKVSQVLGSIFEQQDTYTRQVRMPMPPLLLADRVLGIDATAGAYGQKGVIWTETDIGEDAWYLHNGHMPAGLLIESGQADLLLISYLGADFQNKGERVYRLLGCEATFHGALPAVGDTLHFQIHVDGYAQQSDVRLFFFHYDCYVVDPQGGTRVALSVRHGQAGFFTDEELANSAGVLWDPREVAPQLNARLDSPALPVTRATFGAEQVTAFAEGRITDCFGDRFWPTQTHVRTPTIAGGRMLLFDEVVDFDAGGGPWGRGYLRAEDHLAVDEWFFEGHFKNDPCMPGTLMLEGCLQTMAFYLTAVGYTLERDGWRFEPVPEETYTLRARGQVTPGARTVIYELFVEELWDGPHPTIYADLLCTVDGLRAFHCRRMGLRLVPAYPLESRLSLLAGCELYDPTPIRNARTSDHVYDPRSIAACAWGRPSHAFGASFTRFDRPEHCPRLPGPPYLFMTRIINLDAEEGKPISGGTLEAEYQIPADAWYFSENGSRTMPYAVLLEAALQPCGWFASYKGIVLQSDMPLYFRNLDGTATQLCAVLPEDGLLRTQVTSTTLSRLGSMTIVGFEVACHVGSRRVFEMTTSFGFFPKEALADQAGLPSTDADRVRLGEPSDFRRELGPRPARYCDRMPALPGPMLLLLDRISGFWPEGGRSKLGRVRAEIDVDPQSWFFKCHFMGDPVQPGSLGIEAMIQTLQFYMLETDMHVGIERPHFEPVQLGRALTWKYRGQVLPSATQVTVDVEITERGTVPAPSGQGGTVSEAFVVADISYWVDGLRIYEATGLGMRMVSAPTAWHADGDELLNPAEDHWLRDHCPTWTVPALAMMSMVDRLAAGALVRAPGRKVTGLRNVRVHRWLAFAEADQTARRLKVLGTPLNNRALLMQLQLWEEAQHRYATVASGDVLVCETWPLPGAIWEPLQDAVEMPNPYVTGELFHGPAYQMLTTLWMNERGATYWLDLDAGAVPPGAINQGLLDAATHGIPHDALGRWSAEIPADVAAYPVLITEAQFFGATPTRGRARCEARFGGFHEGNQQFPVVHIQIILQENGAKEHIWAEIELVEALFPKGPIGRVDPAVRRAFLQAHEYTSAVRLSHTHDSTTILLDKEVRESDWLSGTVAAAYGIGRQGQPAASLQWLTKQVAIREHVAHQIGVHPARLIVNEHAAQQLREADGHDPDGLCTIIVAAAERPLNCFAVTAQRIADGWRVADVPVTHECRVDHHGTLTVEPVRNFWRNQMQIRPSLVEDLTLALMQRFVKSVAIEDPAAFAALKGQGVLYLANHQLDVESLLFVSLMTGLQETLTAAVARQELNESWVGPYFEQSILHPHLTDLGMLLLIDRASPQGVLASLQAALDRIRNAQSSLLIHVEGVHAQRARQPVTVVSASLIDMAVEREIPIVPVRFAGGLPVDAVDAPLAFPAGYGKQEIWLGTPILPGALATLSSAERKAEVLAAINGFGGRWQCEEPSPADSAFAEMVRSWQASYNVSETQAVLGCTLAACAHPSAETQWLLAALNQDPSAAALQIDDETQRWMRGFNRQILGLPFGDK